VLFFTQQIEGRTTLRVSPELTQSSLTGKPVKKIIVVPGRMVNIVTG